MTHSPLEGCHLDYVMLLHLSRCIMSIFSDLVEEVMEKFMDDFSIYGSSFEDCLKNLEKILQRCQDKNLALNWEKCHFMVTKGIVDSSAVGYIRINNIYKPNSSYYRSMATTV